MSVKSAKITMNETDIKPIKDLLPHGSGINGRWEVITLQGQDGLMCLPKYM